MGTLQIGAENAPGDGVICTSANGGGFNGNSACYFYSPAAYNGTYGYHFISNGAATFVGQLTAQMQAPGAANTMRFRFYFRVGTLPAGNLQELFWIGNYQYGVSLFGLRLQSNGTLVLENGAGATPFISTLAIQTNVWYRLEFNFAPSNTLTGANSRVLLWCGPSESAGTAVNSTTQAYYYSTTFQAASTNSAVIPGVGAISVGIGGTVSMISGATLQFDDFAVDNGTWTNTPSTWWGKSLKVWSAGNVLRVTPAMFVNNPASLPVKSSVLPLDSLVRMNLDTDVSHSAVLPARASPLMTLFPVLGKESTISMSAGVGSLVLGTDPVLHPFVLPVSALGSLVLNRGPNSIPSVLAAQILARLTVSGYRTTSATWAAGVLTSALYGPSVDVQGLLGMDGAGQVIMAISDLYIDTWRTTALARMELPGERLVLGTFAPAGVGGLDLLGLASKTSVLAMNSPPRLVLNGLKNQSQVWKADALARLILTGRLNQSRVLSMSVIAELAILARVLHDQLIYDDVIARVIDWRHRADLFTGEVLSGVISATAHSALFLHTDSLALLLPSGNDAVILE